MKKEGKTEIETVAFICEYCNELVSKGKCGEHRQNTGHKNFMPLKGIGELKGLNKTKL